MFEVIKIEKGMLKRYQQIIIGILDIYTGLILILSFGFLRPKYDRGNYVFNLLMKQTETEDHTYNSPIRTKRRERRQQSLKQINK